MAKLDDLVEQLAFGRELAKPEPSLGLYLSPDVVYLSETRLKDGRLVVDHLVRIPIPAAADAKKTAGATATMNTDFLSDPAKISGLIRQSMSQLRWNSKSVRVTLSHHLGLLRYFTMPAMEKRFLKSAVPLEAKKYIPIPFDVLAHDFSTTPLPPDATGKPRVGILIAVTQKKNIANVQGLLDSLGLKLAGLEVAPVSSLRLWQAIDAPKDAAPFLHVHVDGASVRIMVIDRGVPVFFREVFLGEDATPNDLRKIDLTGCLSFAQKQLGIANVSRVRVSGTLPGAGLAEMMNAFAQDTGLPAALQDTPKLLSIKAGDWGGYAALGASAYSLNPVSGALDLATADTRVTDDERQTARDIMIAGALLSVVIAAAGIFTSATYAYHAQDLHKYDSQLDPTVRSAIGSMQQAAIESKITDMQNQLDQLRAISAGAAASRPKTSAILKQIIDVMPDKIWFDHITVLNPLMGAEKSPMDISLYGHAQDRTVGDEQNLAFQFKDALTRVPMIGKNFEVSLSLTKQADQGGDSGSPAGLDPKALAEKLEDRTSFTLELKGKR